MVAANLVPGGQEPIRSVHFRRGVGREGVRGWGSVVFLSFRFFVFFSSGFLFFFSSNEFLFSFSFGSSWGSFDFSCWFFFGINLNKSSDGGVLRPEKTCN